MMLESDMVRRRAPAVVHTLPQCQTRVRALTEASDVASLRRSVRDAEGRVSGFPTRDNEARECDVAGGFAP